MLSKRPGCGCAINPDDVDIGLATLSSAACNRNAENISFRQRAGKRLQMVGDSLAKSLVPSH
jgi:hypothetical protein